MCKHGSHAAVERASPRAVCAIAPSDASRRPATAPDMVRCRRSFTCNARQGCCDGKAAAAARASGMLIRRVEQGCVTDRCPCFVPAIELPRAQRPGLIEKSWLPGPSRAAVAHHRQRGGWATLSSPAYEAAE